MGMGWGISSEPQITRIKGLHGLRTSIALRVQSIDWSLSVALRPVRSTCQQKGLVGSAHPTGVMAKRSVSRLKEKSMKFRHKITLSLLLTIVLCGVAFAQVVEIPDPNLRVAIREALNLPVGASVTRAGLQQLTRLDAANRQVKNLTGLEHATSLTYLALQNNDVSDLRALSSLVNLTFLRLHGNQINDLSPLANLTKLSTLLLDSNNITDLGPLANLTRLTTLVLGNNNITDISPLANIVNLERLELQNNRITDITPLENLTNLEHLYTHNNPIFDPDSPVVHIPDPNLRAGLREILGLPADSPIPLDLMRQVPTLVFGARDITNIEGLQHATNLWYLNLSGNPISDISPLAALVKLERLDLLSCDNIVDVSPLSELYSLRHLELGKNKIRDVTPLANLHNLERLYINRNRIIDHSPLDNLQLLDFRYDQECDMPHLPSAPRIENRQFPSVFGAFYENTSNQPHLSRTENFAQHDMVFKSWLFDIVQFDNGNHWEIRGDIDGAIAQRDRLLSLNPNILFLAGVKMFDTGCKEFPEDWPYWKRDEQGNIVREGRFCDIEFTNPGFQDLMISQAIAVSRCGLYDGIFIDWWTEQVPPDELHARETIIRRIRAETRPDLLVLVNTNDRIFPRTAPFINGGYMESFFPHRYTGEELEKRVTKAEHVLRWMESNLKSPVINALAAGTYDAEPPDSPYNLRWVRAVTTLSLTHSDGYITFGVGSDDARHNWYDFWDADLGQPVGEKGQLYKDRSSERTASAIEIPGLYIREFTNGWAVYNHSGEPQVITLPEEAQGVASGRRNTEHALPNLDGEMYLRAAPKNPADVNEDGVVNIFDLTLVAQALSTGNGQGDVNGDGVINVFDLVMVAEALQ